MLTEVLTALDQGNFQQAEKLLATLPPEDPRVLLCRGQLYLKTERLEEAESDFRQLLRLNCGPKLTQMARRGLEKIEQIRQQQRQQAILATHAVVGVEQQGLLVLEGVAASEQRTILARLLATMFKIDPYTARLLIPSRGWRLIRTGNFAELTVYCQELKQQGFTLFCVPFEALTATPVLQVRYFVALEPQPRVVCTSSLSPEPVELTFTWSQVSQRVEGLLPIFEQVFDRDRQGKVTRKEQIQDHAQCCDLHLFQQNQILRFYRGGYQFHQGIPLNQVAEVIQSDLELDQNTSWVKWRQLSSLWQQHCGDRPVWQDFTSFAETALDFSELLSKIPPHINLFRREDSPWDAAFMLYSSLAFHRDRSGSNR
ncbi:tetratricopeptide repeat protein [Thermosynechococcus sp. GLH187]|uniref:tetratricopeptide repeat protein n=1 Tax=unclassified Thermosynechococcus TaxID=2622553 RepID=UPI00197DC2A4|nr:MULTISPECIES: tetratricopeptide repeat protein [unclassified Thermosynechococcus]QSF50152.1 tetratricopeptide repeat protein [Thermosynechococcus sp. TA-1]WNC46120.1 tetratricopeptide repeat protein [Thermosynechococcus sp. GLH187]WNC48657.1 tetratricopeptide repeat protein [Thermosynechococcus sp. GLH333]WNC51190.1 tetratricopeptide repeat protein [Thermosynechococcus sp. GLH87]WNC53726.1 tetratricopeptide repeat protein [Thermosynechococcus sp. TG215]